MASYRERIQRYLQEHPGATKAEARGHGGTPEHPGRGKGQEKYADYYERRSELERHVNELKQNAYGNLPNWNADGAAETTEKISMSSMAKAEPYDDLYEFLYDYPELEDEFGYYH